MWQTYTFIAIQLQQNPVKPKAISFEKFYPNVIAWKKPFFGKYVLFAGGFRWQSQFRFQFDDIDVDWFVSIGYAFGNAMQQQGM